MARVFVSHSSDDRALAGEIHQWLVEDHHEVFLDQDLRDGIAVGEEWEQRLYERLRWADAVVCIVTSAYLASMWCTAELSIARSRGARLLPLLAEPDVIHPLLQSTHYTNHVGDPVTARKALSAALRQIDAAGGWGWPDGRCPFPGLRPFDTDLHRVFFGRSGEVAALAGLLRSPAEWADRGVLLVVGPSGCGKSSLVRAGLVPVIANEAGWLTLAPFVPGADPVAALTRELAAGAQRLDLGWTVAQVRQRLDVDGLGGLADELLLAAPDVAGWWWRRHLLVMVDQFEELLTQATPAARAQFVRLLQPALDHPVHVVATLRPEFLDPLLASPELDGLPTRLFTLRPLRRSALATVIEGPARLAGIGIDQSLVDRLVTDTDTGEALPLLAFTLEQLADGVDRGGHLSAGRYEQLGGVQGALVRQADAALAEARAASGRTSTDVIEGLLRLVTVDEQGHPIRWRIHRDELPEPVRSELDAFVARRLLTTDTDTDAVFLEVTHEAFLSAWPPLAGAITDTASALRMRRGIEQAAAEWDDDGRPFAQLWERGQLAAAMNDIGADIRRARRPDGSPEVAAMLSLRRRLPTWLPARNQVLVTDRVDLSQRARAFLLASIRRDRRQRWRAVTILSVLLALATAAAGVALIQQRAAQRQQRVAAVRGLLAQVDAARSSDPHLALLLGIAAQHVQHDGETQASLVETLTASHYAGTLTGHSDPVLSVAFAPDGRTLATGSADARVILWDLSDRTRPRRLGQPLTGHGGNVFSVAFAPDGRTLATGSADARVILWDLSDRTRPRRLGQPLMYDDEVATAVFAPDGRTLVTGTFNGTIILWDVSNRARPRRLGQLLADGRGVLSVAFAPDGRTLVTINTYTITLWDLSNRARPRRLGVPLTSSAPLRLVAFAPDGRTLATGSEDKTVILWDVADRARPRRLGVPLTSSAPVSSVGFAPDGRTLATGSGDATILWDVADRARPRRLGQPLTGHSGTVFSVAFAPDGRTLATGSADATVILWDLSGRTRPRRLGQPLTHDDVVAAVAFAPDGRTLATRVLGGTVILRDLTDRARPHRLGQALTGGFLSVAFAPDGRTLATSSGDATILWDVADRARPRRLGQPLTGHSGTVFSVAFASDGRTLATGGEDKTVILWDLSDRTRPRRLGQALVHEADVLSVAFTPDSRTLATSSGGAITLWDLSDRARPRRLGQPPTHNSAVGNLVFAPDGRTLATSSNDTSTDTIVNLWDVADRARPSRLGQPLIHSAPVGSVAFAPDGRTLATGSDDATVILWDLSDRTRPRRLGQPLIGHRTTVTSVAFAPDGRTLATGSEDKTAILWDLTKLNELRQHAAERACLLTQRGLDRNEWARFIPGLRYQSTCPS